MCWIPTVAGAGVFGSAEDALAEWQQAVGPAAGTALTPSTPEATARLLAPGLKTGPMWGAAGTSRGPLTLRLLTAPDRDDGAPDP